MTGRITGRLSNLAGGVLGARDGDGSVPQAALFAYAVRIASAGILFLSQLVLARWMGSFEYGIYVLVWTWVQLLAAISSLGLSTSIIRFVPQYRVAASPGKLRGVLFFSRGVTFASSTVVALAGALVLVLLGDRVENYYLVPLLLGFVVVPIYALMDVHDGIGRSLGWLGWALLPVFVWRPLLLLLFMVGALAAGAPTSATTAVWCMIGAAWVSGLCQFLVMGRRLTSVAPKTSAAFEPVNWMRVSLPMLLVEGFHIIMINTDVLILGLFVTPDQVGLYYAAAKILGLVSIIIFAIATASGHRFASLHAEGDTSGLRNFVRDATRWTFWPSLASAAVILALGYPILWLFGEAFTAGYPIMFILAVGLLARASIGPSERMLNVIGQQDACARVFFTSLLGNIAFNLVLVPIFGIYGAAAATSMALIMEAWLMNRVVKTSVGVSAFVLGLRGALKPAE